MNTHQQHAAPDFTRLGPAVGDSVLIIGGCGGIGGGVVEAALAIGLKICVMDLDASIAARNPADRAQYITLDLRDAASIETAFSSMDASGFSPNHVVFASGYTSDLTPVKDMSAHYLDDIMGGNLRGHVLAARASLARMQTGSFVFISTAIGQVGAPGYGAYGMAKAGINALTRIIAAEAAPHIRVNGVAPGAVDSAFIRGGLGRGVSDMETAATGHPARFDKAAYIARTPLGRLGVPDDITGPILFLMSDAARYITGQVLHVNGGGFMRD